MLALLGMLGVFANQVLFALPGAGLSRGTWLGALYIAIFPTTIAYALSTWAIRRSSPALVAALIAASFLGERIGWVQAAGFVLILLGLWRVSTGD